MRNSMRKIFAFLFCDFIGIFISLTGTVSANQEIATELIVGDTGTLIFPCAYTDSVYFQACIFDATGAQQAYAHVASATWGGAYGSYFRKVEYLADIPGTFVINATASNWTDPKVWVTKVVPAKYIQESTMYYLSSSIYRTDTWSVASPIVRSSSLNMETALWETFANDRGDNQYRHHVVIYDQATNISNYFQKAWHFWVSTPAEVWAILARAVPDGDVTRYKKQ